MSIAPKGPKGKAGLQIAGQLPHKTGTKHGKTLERTGINLHFAQTGFSAMARVLPS